MIMRHVSFLVVLASLAGCATIFHGTQQDVSVTCDSPRATLRADGSVVAPGRVSLKRGDEHTITAEAPGTAPSEVVVKREVSWGWAILDGAVSIVFFPIGLVAPVVDLADGAFWDLVPEHVRVPAPGPAGQPY
jgi:hypothetical protein